MITNVWSIDQEMLDIEEGNGGKTHGSLWVGRNRKDFEGELGESEDRNKRIRWGEGEEFCWVRECGGTAETEGHLRDGVETQCSGNFLKYRKAILMRSPNNGWYGVQSCHLLSPNEAHRSRTKLSCWPRGPMEVTKQSRLLLRQWAPLNKLTVGPHCQDSTHMTHWMRRSVGGA